MERSLMKKQSKKNSITSSSQSERRSGTRKLLPKRPRRTVMGLDLSLRGTGVVVVRGSKVLYSARLPTEALPSSGTLASQISGLRPNGSFRGTDEECIEYVKKKIRKIFKKYEPDLTVLENYAFSKHSRSLSVLHEVGGVVKNMLHRLEAPWCVATPTEVKSHATGNGGASKADMLIAAKHAGHDFRNSDEADAFWCADWGLVNYKRLVD